jgi:hypothetical protein
MVDSCRKGNAFLHTKIFEDFSRRLEKNEFRYNICTIKKRDIITLLLNINLDQVEKKFHYLSGGDTACRM